MLNGFDRRKVDLGKNKNRMNEKFRVGVELVSSPPAVTTPTPITTTTGEGGGLIGGCKVRPSKQRPSFSAMATKAPNTASLRRGRTIIQYLLTFSCSLLKSYMTQLSNPWWMSNSVCMGFGNAMRTGSSRRFKRYPTTYMRVSSQLPLS